MDKTATGIAITADVRKKQAEFWTLEQQFQDIEKKRGPAQEEYNELRGRFSGAHPELQKLRDVLIQAGNAQSEIRRAQRMLCNWIEATHVIKQGNQNFRPGVATTGHPG